MGVRSLCEVMTTTSQPRALGEHSDEQIQLVAAGLVRLAGSDLAADQLQRLYGEERAEAALRALAQRIDRAARAAELREEYLQRTARRARHLNRLRVGVADSPTPTASQVIERRPSTSGRIIRTDVRSPRSHVDERV